MANQTQNSGEAHEVTFVAYPKLLFTWPLILAGFLFYFIAGGAQEGNEGWLEGLAWIYILIVTVVILTLGVDMTRNQAIMWTIVIVALWVGACYLEDVKHIAVIGGLYSWFDGLGIRYDREFGLALSIVLSIPFLIMIAHSWFDDRWRITHNEFEHYSFGRMNDSLGRGAKTIRTEFPDVFELLLGLAGTLIVFNATGTKELRRIPHIMFLPFVRRRLNKILERTAITTEIYDEEDEEEAGV